MYCRYMCLLGLFYAETCSHAARHHRHYNRMTRINNNSSLNRAARAHYHNINHRLGLSLVLPQQKHNRLRLEGNFLPVRIEIPFLLSATMHYYWKSSCKTSISTQMVLNINIYWCFFASYHVWLIRLADSHTYHSLFLLCTREQGHTFNRVAPGLKENAWHMGHGCQRYRYR